MIENVYGQLCRHLGSGARQARRCEVAAAGGHNCLHRAGRRAAGKTLLAFDARRTFVPALSV